MAAAIYSRWGLASAIVALGWAVGCNAVWGLDPGAVMGAGGTGGSSGDGGAVAAGGNGGAMPCASLGTCPTGSTCTEAAACDAGHCVDGVCCAGACDGVCEACDLAGRVGQCTPQPAGFLAIDECPASGDIASSCNGMSACGGEYRWSSAFGGSNDDVAADVALDGVDGMLVAGRCSTGTNFGGGNLPHNGNGDVYVAKLGPGGDHVWSLSFGGPGTDQAEDVVADGSGGVFVTGLFRNLMTVGNTVLTSAGETDGFVAQLDGTGQALWAASFGGSSFDRGVSLAAGPGGSVLLAGLQNNVDFSQLCAASDPLSNGIFVARVESSGACTWSRSFDAGKTYNGVAVATDAEGNVLLTGSIEEAGPIGGPELAYAGASDLFVAKFDPAGGHLWSTSFGGENEDVGRAIAVTPAGNVIVAGIFDSPSLDLGAAGMLTSAGMKDIFMLELDPNGVPLRSRRFGGAEDDFVDSLELDPSGALLVAGTFGGSVDFGGGALNSAGLGDVFAVKLSASWEHLWSRRFGGTQSDGDGLIVADASGHLLLAGTFRGSGDFGGPALDTAGLRDIFVLKLAP